MVRRLAAASLIALAVATLAGCGSTPKADYVPDGGDHDEASLQTLLADHDFSGVTDIATADAADVRQDVLIDLRTQGDDASEAADLMTSQFPQPTLAVPVLVEAGTFQGADAWIIFEAWGDEGGELTHRRAWVFERDSGALVWTGSLR
jgi:hypothetical protein